VFRAIAALGLLSATAANAAVTLTSSTPWWERVTVTVSDDGKAHSCRYETSLNPNQPQDCTASDNQAALAKSSGGGGKDQYTAITFERRFTPGEKPTQAALQPGETFLGGQVMALGIDARGAVDQCRVIATSGAVTPQYSCDDAAAERFDASAGTARARTPERAGYLMIVVYGHSEHAV
jgi:hypothetical protein